MKIYIVGPPGSGKTTLSKKLSKKYKVKRYELDCIVHDDKNGHIKRSNKEIDKLFNNILKEKSWIIEDVGRNKFIKGREKCDKIYYLDIPKKEVYKRVINRWIKQKKGIEEYHYPPTLSYLYKMLKVVNSYYKKEKEKIKSLENYKDKLIYITKEELNKRY